MHKSIMTTFIKLKTSYGVKSTFGSQTKFYTLANDSRYSYEISQNKLYYNNKIMSIFLGKRLSERVIL